MSCATLNIGLNLMLIPHLGVVGAGVATLASYSVLAVLMASAGHRLLPVVLPWATLARSGLSAAVMYLAVFLILPGRHFLTVGIRVALGALIYAVLITLVDRDARDMVVKALKR
jgi:O-antigen/teichoic acid export membrane protein